MNCFSLGRKTVSSGSNEVFLKKIGFHIVSIMVSTSITLVSTNSSISLRHRFCTLLVETVIEIRQNPLSKKYIFFSIQVFSQEQGKGRSFL